MNKLYLKFTQYFFETTNIYRIISLGILSLVLVVISMFIYNHTIEMLIGILGGITLGLFLTGLRVRAAYLQKVR
jgi:hypothetical protein